MGELAILGVLANRKKETVKAFLESIPPKLRATIRTVCSDLYEGYLQAVHEVLPKARQVIDRFHVAKLYREAADALRKTRTETTANDAVQGPTTSNSKAVCGPSARMRPT